ncbi:MAG: hypothetical protein NW226_21035 [Microscillaceae bacterium]|nr:hypothetical protein [Microscillaceae bacterium]
MIFDISILIGSAGISYYLIHWYKKRKKIPSLRNVLGILEKIKENTFLPDNVSESEVENLLAHKLLHFFEEVHTQYYLGGIKGAKDRIDIDIAHGKLGIEIKLAAQLKKSNERNRLLGQMDLYKERKYNLNNLLVIIVGSKKHQKQEVISELIKILTEKGVYCYYWSTE